MKRNLSTAKITQTMLSASLAITNILVAATNDAAAFAFVAPLSRVVRNNKETTIYGVKVGIFFGTSTGSSQEVADLIAVEFGDVASSPIEIDSVQGSVVAEFEKYDSLVVWNTGADMERSGTGWDEIYYSEMKDLNIAGKKVAVFGLGDSVSYSENYADASGELHDVFESLGCTMIGYTSQVGYLHEESKAIRGDKFCGLLLDAVNQEELTEGRVKSWVAALIDEGILDSGAAAPSVQSPSPVPQSFETEVAVVEPVQINADVAATQPAKKEEGFVGHYNSITDKTWWVGNNGRSSFVTTGPPEIHAATKTSLSP
jgi:flavodoxin I